MASLKAWFGSLAKWQKGCLAAATLFLALGLVALLVEDPGARQPTLDNQSTQGTGNPGEPSNLLPAGEQPEGTGANTPRPGAGATPWSAGFFRLGFSFFAGFSIGMALRTFLKLAVIGSGIALLLLFLLAYVELVTVHWTAIDSLFENLVERVSGEADRFQSFITGSLPSTALAALGLVTGIRGRRR